MLKIVVKKERSINSDQLSQNRNFYYSVIAPLFWKCLSALYGFPLEFAKKKKHKKNPNPFTFRYIPEEKEEPPTVSEY